MNLCYPWIFSILYFVYLHLIEMVSSEDEERLYIDLFRGYQSLVRPVRRVNDSALKVSMSLQLVLLINVEEKHQIMHTNVWLTMEWFDYQLRWNPEDYGGTKQIRIPPDKTWLPDIVLFNNADGNYEVSYYSNVVLDHSGQVLWVPPAIYKSSCIIDVEHFPFDQQSCFMSFGSWTYGSHELELDFQGSIKAVDVTEYYKSSIWDLIDCPATKTNQRNLIRYDIILRRKTLFYTVVLIIPTVLMAFLSMMVFYLPTDAGEKITLAISILLSLVVFLLLVSKILPPTSKTIPLMAKYLLLTFVLNIITILITVIIINVYFRGPTTHRMPKWVRSVFLGFFATVLLMKRPKRPSLRHVEKIAMAAAGNRTPLFGLAGLPGVRPPEAERRLKVVNAIDLLTIPPDYAHHPHCGVAVGSPPVRFRDAAGGPLYDASVQSAESIELLARGGAESPSDSLQLSHDAMRTAEAIEYIAEHLKQDEEYKKVRDDWKYVAMVIDRLLLYLFFGVTLGGTLGILFSAPTIFDSVDQDAVLEQLRLRYKPNT